MPEVLESAALIDKEQAILARGTHLLASLPEIYVRLAGFLFSARFPVLHGSPLSKRTPSQATCQGKSASTDGTFSYFTSIVKT
jgi:hypothetical protein